MKNEIYENKLNSKNYVNPDINTILENLTNSIHLGKYEDVIKNYIRLKNEEYSLILKEIETLKLNENINLYHEHDSRENISPIMSNMKKLPTNIESLSDQIKLVKTSNKLKKFKSNQGKLLSDLILRKHSSKILNSSLQYKKSDCLYSSEMLNSSEFKSSSAKGKEDIISLNEINISSSIYDKNYIEPFQFDANSNNINIEDKTSYSKEKLLESEIKNTQDKLKVGNINLDYDMRNKNLLNNVINVKLKIFQPIFE